MNSDASDLPKPSGDVTGSDHLQPLDVPVFNCLVYVSAVEGNAVRARVANLPDIEFVAPSERAALAQIIPEFKRRVGEWLQSGERIPWIEPPLPAESDEQQRLIPVHL